VSKRQRLVSGGVAGVGLLLLIVLALTNTALGSKHRPKTETKTWNDEAIKAAYVATQLRELDKAHSSLILSYDLENLTDSDYRLVEGPGLVIMGKLSSGESLTQEESIHLGYPIFLPARQRARMAIEISGPFGWPAHNDPQSDDKLRDFVKQRLAPIKDFVLYDEASHCEIQLPGAWQHLQQTKQAN
jgi:hypothetical protein